MIKLSELVAANPEDTIDNIINSKTYTSFLKSLKQNADDPKVKSLLNTGLHDDALQSDDIHYTKINVKLKKLIPTQNEIDLEKTLKNILKGEYNILSYLQNNSIVVGTPIIIANGKYIIDGHHRWSQTFCLNPDIEISCVNITGIKNWQDVLKSVQLHIAGEHGSEIPSGDTSGANLLKCSNDKILKYINSNIVESVVNDIYSYALNANDDIKYNAKKKLVADYLCDNINLMKKIKLPKGAIKRNLMPQTSDSQTLRAMFS